MTPDTAPDSPAKLRRFLVLALGSVGIVYGDIGTSPLYAFRESISHLRAGTGAIVAGDVTGIISLMLWTLIVIVAIKYVWLLMRFDNRGEGGILSLMALVQGASARHKGLTLAIGMIGAGLFFGDAALTPAISVLSAVEGLGVIKGLEGQIDGVIVPIALVLLVGLFVIQRYGTGGIGHWFGPVCLVWFVTLAILGIVGISKAPEVLGALNPAAGVKVLLAHPGLALAILGSVFLTVTGAEALYADMGHFGSGPIRLAWITLVFPCLALNYLGQGALVLSDPTMADNPFFRLAPDWFQLPLVGLATLATIIASQAVISGAFSMTRQAVQLGLLPRMTLRQTSEAHAGQIYAPEVNWILMVAVAILVLLFKSSSALASAYGISVVGAMVTSSLLAVLALHRLNGRRLVTAALLLSPFIIVETVFLVANLTKIAHGGFVPLVIAAAIILIMSAWMRGTRAMAKAELRDVKMADVLDMLAQRPPLRARGAAVFLTATPETAPVALMHNLKHNQVLHEQVILLTVKVSDRPHVTPEEQVTIAPVAEGVKALTMTFGFMDTPNVTTGLTLARTRGLKFDIMRTSFFLSRRTLVSGRSTGFAKVLDAIFIVLSRNAVRAADYFHIPVSRVVELGAQVVI